MQWLYNKPRNRPQESCFGIFFLFLIEENAFFSNCCCWRTLPKTLAVRNSFNRWSCFETSTPSKRLFLSLFDRETTYLYYTHQRYPYWRPYNTQNVLSLSINLNYPKRMMRVVVMAIEKREMIHIWHYCNQIHFNIGDTYIVTLLRFWLILCLFIAIIISFYKLFRLLF